VLIFLVLVIIVFEVVWNYNRLGRILKPKTRDKEEVKLEDLIEDRSKVKSQADADITLNPVVQARFEIEAGQKAQGRTQQRPGAAGALGRLMRNVGDAAATLTKSTGGADTAAKKKEQMRAIDRNLQREANAASAAVADANDRTVQEAMEAAMEAQKYNQGPKKKAAYPPAASASE